MVSLRAIFFQSFVATRDSTQVWNLFRFFFITGEALLNASCFYYLLIVYFKKDFTFMAIFAQLHTVELKSMWRKELLDKVYQAEEFLYLTLQSVP